MAFMKGLRFWVPALVALLSVAGVGRAQTGYRVGVLYSPSPGYLGMRATSPYYLVPATPEFNGFSPQAYSSYITASRPTYLTSINYPWMYGSYGDMSAPSSLVLSGQPSYYDVAPTIYNVYETPTRSLTGYRYIPDTGAMPVPTTATVDVRLPAEAELRFDGVLLNQGGGLRRFVTPPLTPGDRYIYHVHATWTENGRDVAQDRDVTFRPGDQVNIDFLTPPSANETGTRSLRTSRR